MKFKSLVLVLIAVSAMTGCGKKEPSASAGNATHAAQMPAAQPSGTTGRSTQPDPVQGLSNVALDNIRLSERPASDGKSQEWVVRATLVNRSAEPLNGGEFVIDLARKGEAQPFARHGTQIYFAPEVAPGRSTSFLASVPENGVQDKPPVEAIVATVRVMKAIAKPKVATAWKPLDPSTAEVRVVSETVVLTKDGKVVGKIPPAATVRANPASPYPVTADSKKL